MHNVLVIGQIILNVLLIIDSILKVVTYGLIMHRNSYLRKMDGIS
jgi:hypothetical protein